MKLIAIKEKEVNGSILIMKISRNCQPLLTIKMANKAAQLDGYAATGLGRYSAPARGSANSR